MDIRAFRDFGAVLVEKSRKDLVHYFLQYWENKPTCTIQRTAENLEKKR